MKRFLKLLKIIKYYLTDRNNMFPMFVLKLEAEEQLDFCMKNNIRNTEQLEDLLFHIGAYLDIQKFSTLQNCKILQNCKMEDIEKQRAVERDFIFDLAKNLAIGGIKCQ